MKNLIKTLKEAEKKVFEAKEKERKLLREIGKKLDLSEIEDEDERNNFLWNLGIVYQSADGFCLNDDEGNNYSINLIFEYLKKNGKIDFYELKKTMI